MIKMNKERDSAIYMNQKIKKCKQLKFGYKIIDVSMYKTDQLKQTKAAIRYLNNDDDVNGICLEVFFQNQ